MIRAATTGWNAYYYPSRERHSIVGWTEHDGSPMIIHPATGSLVPAADFTTADGHTFSGVTDEREKDRRQDEESFRRGVQLSRAWWEKDAETLVALCAEADADGPRPLSLIVGLLHFFDVFLEDVKRLHDIGKTGSGDVQGHRAAATGNQGS
ncbi:hypothetical protein GCM10017673_52490 [Streptosporangium violaceochromogenes]|nr:hypothetical protein GCM10017673_52490 [Streptosporangium violaceochromogenes]